jgi:hypothetical protein
MKRRVVGLDLNGRMDWAARDWDVDVIEQGASGVTVLRGGLLSGVVRTLDGNWIAGPQAEMAPHGRGNGWGEIGKPERRRGLAAAFDHIAQGGWHAEAVGAAVDALARHADDVVVAVPDLPEFAEASQAALLDAVVNRLRRGRLLWRSVAAFLGLLNDGKITADQLNCQFRIVIHTGGGLEVQELTLRTDDDHPGHVAPRRDGPGTLVGQEVGLDPLFERSGHLTREQNGHVDWSLCDPSRLGPSILTGAAQLGDVEVVRAFNASWLEVVAPDIKPSAAFPQLVAVRPSGRPITATFLVTPLAPNFAEQLVRFLEPTWGAVSCVTPDLIARGCLLAGRLIERGLPHYFDRLEPVSIVVMRGDDPQFEHPTSPDAVVPANRRRQLHPAWQDLIPRNAVVPANKEYVSRDLRGFEWGRGKTDAEFYICKGDTDVGEVRHWHVTKPSGPRENVQVILRIRQTPGQSWARLTVSSLDWDVLARNPVALEWERLNPLSQTPDEVLDRLRNPPPPIPVRVVERAHVDLWNGAPWAGEGHISRLALQHFELPNAKVNPAAWANELRRSRRHPQTRDRFWAIGTDGEMPVGLSTEVIEGFTAAMQKISQIVLSASIQYPLRSNDPIMALTWCFGRCSEEVQDAIVAALRADLEGRSHALLAPKHSLRVLRQGAGRTISGVKRLAFLFDYIDRSTWNNDTINALAMALTRREEAPRALTREQVDAFVKRLASHLLDQIRNRSFKLKFRNTLSAIAGLFRWRICQPDALLAARDPPDPIAFELLGVLKEAEELLKQPELQVPQSEQKRKDIGSIIEFLEGGGDPNILIQIERGEEEETD